MNRHLKNTLIALAGLYFGVAVIGKFCAPKSTPTVEERNAQFYCNMVYLHEHDHTVGWPDFRHVYKDMCKADGSLNQEYIRGQ